MGAGFLRRFGWVLVTVYSLLLLFGLAWATLGSSQVLLVNTPWFAGLVTGGGGELQAGVLRAGQAQKVTTATNLAEAWGLDLTTRQGVWQCVPKTYRPVADGGRLTVRSAYSWSLAGLALGGRIDGNLAAVPGQSNASPMTFEMQAPMLALPAWLLLAVLVAIWGYRLWLAPRWLAWSRVRNGRCIRCGYLMAGVQDHRCPECGKFVPRKYRR